MFGCGLGPEIQKILKPLKNHASKSNDKGFQTVLVTSTVSKVWCNLSLVLMIWYLDCLFIGSWILYESFRLQNFVTFGFCFRIV